MTEFAKGMNIKAIQTKYGELLQNEDKDLEDDVDKHNYDEEIPF